MSKRVEEDAVNKAQFNTIDANKWYLSVLCSYGKIKIQPPSPRPHCSEQKLYVLPLCCSTAAAAALKRISAGVYSPIHGTRDLLVFVVKL